MMVLDGNDIKIMLITYGVYFKDIIDDHKNKLTHFGYYRVMKKFLDQFGKECMLLGLEDGILQKERKN